ncbi:MAG: hypothetical protein OXI57_11910 [Rhodospirillales bacterium]|nr:hypothetical protein [Rhodospirillales bacterium]
MQAAGLESRPRLRVPGATDVQREAAQAVSFLEEHERFAVERFARDLFATSSLYILGVDHFDGRGSSASPSVQQERQCAALAKRLVFGLGDASENDSRASFY